MEANLCLGPRFLMSVGDVLREQTKVSTVMNASSDHGEGFLQQMWDYMRATNVLQSPVLPASFAFLTHVLLCLPYLLLDMLAGFSPQVQQWRISAPPPTLRQWFFCFGRVLRAYLTAVLPLTALLQVLRSPVMPEHAPSRWQLVVEVSVCLLLFDAFFFAWHLFMHKTPWLYRSIHQAHHQQRQPFALTAQDATGAELLSLLLLAMASARLVGCHPLSETVFHLVNTWLAVEDHCGYNLPWALHRLLPLMGGAPYHQDHHIFFRDRIRFFPPVDSKVSHTHGATTVCSSSVLTRRH